MANTRKNGKKFVYNNMFKILYLCSTGPGVEREERSLWAPGDKRRQNERKINF